MIFSLSAFKPLLTKTLLSVVLPEVLHPEHSISKVGT